MSDQIQKVDLSIHLNEQRDLARNMISDGERMVNEGKAIIRMIQGIRDEFDLNKKVKK